MNNWIKVKDKRPSDGDKVLVCERFNIHLVDVLKGNLIIAEDGWRYNITDFDYWMLVEPPKGEITWN